MLTKPPVLSRMNSVLGTKFHISYRGVSTRLAKCLNRFLNVNVVVATFNQEKALVGELRVELRLKL